METSDCAVAARTPPVEVDPHNTSALSRAKNASSPRRKWRPHVSRPPRADRGVLDRIQITPHSSFTGRRSPLRPRRMAGHAGLKGHLRGRTLDVAIQEPAGNVQRFLARRATGHLRTVFMSASGARAPLSWPRTGGGAHRYSWDPPLQTSRNRLVMIFREERCTAGSDSNPESGRALYKSNSSGCRAVLLPRIRCTKTTTL